MNFSTPALRLSIVLALLTLNLLLVAKWVGFIPDNTESALESRKILSESLAVQFSAGIARGDTQAIQHTLRSVVERNDTIRSAAIRTRTGELIAVTGEHLGHWTVPVGNQSTATHVMVPLYQNDHKWGTVEIRYVPLWKNDRVTGFSHSFTGLIVFIILGGFIGYFLILRRSLRELDPTAVIPERVQRAFDVLQEGVFILDVKEQIVMANKSFASLFEKTPEAMLGLKGSELGWLNYQTSEQVGQLPWFRVIREDLEHKGAALTLRNRHGAKINLSVNATRVTDNNGVCRGALVTLDDITRLEEKNLELGEMVEKLEIAQQEIRAKSDELEVLANLDPLTRCLNRRSLTTRFDALFTRAKTDRTYLSCLMVDVDHFKSVNDRYGHSAGDEVLKGVSDILRRSTRDTDLVGRYGGEEFCVVLPDLKLETAVRVAERIRQGIEENECGGVSVTASLGVASLELNANTPEELINHADKALYAAKESGRNRVLTWGTYETSVTGSDGNTDRKQTQLHPTEALAEGASQSQLIARIRELEGMLKKRTLELEHYEMYDVKTGLPTRSMFQDRIAQEIARCRRRNGIAAVLSMTIATVNRIHETLGYRAAEELLNACGQRANEVLRKDIDTVAMIDKFKGISMVSMINQTELGILLTDIKQVDSVTWVMKRLLDAFEKPFVIEQTEIYATAFFGVSMYPEDGQSVDVLYASATNACRHAQKLGGGTRYAFASQSLNRKAAEHLEMENLLHSAIGNEEFRIHYQPKITAGSGQIVGFEALLRWENSHLGSVSPAIFIPIAEQSGQIKAIGNWVVAGVCRQLREWREMGLDVLPVAINVSGVQLNQPSFVERIRKVMEEFRVEPRLMEIELTESSFIDAQGSILDILQQIRNLGIHIHMDDFGTGYSTLSQLRNLPLTGIKIDRSFVAEINKDESANKLITSIVSIAEAFGLGVVAEGVENRMQVDYLTQLGCDCQQGYYYSRPVSAEKAEAMLQKRTKALVP